MTAQAPPQPPASVEQAFQAAVAQQQAGHLQEAMALYAAVLQQCPKHAEASYNLGAIATLLHMPATAVPLFMAALDADPRCSRYWVSFLDALVQSGQSSEARRVLALARQDGLRGDDVDAFEQRLTLAAPVAAAMQHPAAQPAPQDIDALLALFREGRVVEAETRARALTQRYPQHGVSWMVLGAALKHQGRSADAIGPMQKSVELLPDNANAYTNLGGALKDVGRLAEAEASLRRALAINSENAQALSNLGITLQAAGKLAEAEVNLRRAVAIDPKMVDAHNNLGNVLKALGRLDDAIASYSRTLQLNPEFAEAHYNIGTVMQALGQLNAAEASYRRALEIRPTFAAALNNLGISLMRLGRLDEAEAHGRHALQCDPKFVDAYVNLGATLMSQGRQTEAEDCYLQAINIDPNCALAHSNRGVALQDLGRLDEAEASFRRALAIDPDYRDALNNLLFVQNYHPDKSGEEIFQVYREFGARFDLPAERIPPHTNDRNPHRRLKIGYVSPDFRKHSALYFVEPLLAQHDKTAVEIFAYVDLSREDELTPRFKKHVDHWIPAHGMTDDELAARIRADGIDILVDHSGHGNGNRLRVFGRKPAPVALTWLGCNYTTGMSTVDYYLTNTLSAPPGSEKFFSETPWRMDGPHYVYAPADGMGEVNALPALRAGHITIGTLTRAIRINHRTLRVWAEILKRIDGSKLVIDSHDFRAAAAQEGLAAKFAAHGIARERLLIGFNSPPWDVLRSLDFAVDCFPHNSGTTLYESLYMGIPFITLAGRPSLGTLGSSILTDVGHPEWIAATEDEYVEIAVALAADLPRLATLRAGLRQNMQSGPLMDAAGFARRVEAAYRGMFNRWSKAHPPTPPNFSPSNATNPSPQDINTLTTLFGQSRYAEAEALARRLTMQFPQHAFGWMALGSACKQMGCGSEALTAMQRAVALAPGEGNAHINLGAVLQDLGRVHEAEASLRRALQINPQNAQALCNLGVTLQALGRVDEAEVVLRRAIHLAPDNALAQNNLGNALKALGRLSEAENSYRRTIVLSPGFTDAHYNLGITLQELGKLDEAEASYRAALQLKADFEMACNNLGITLMALGRPDEAEARYRQALQINPDYADAHCNLGATLLSLGRVNEAETSYRRALQIKPGYALAHSNLGVALQDQGRLDEADACYRRALAIDPQLTAARNNLLFVTNYHPDKTDSEIFSVYREIGAQFDRPEVRTYANQRNTRRRLKIGYVSPDFKMHAARHFIEPLLAHHNKDAVEVFAYAELLREDAVTARYKSVVDQWIPTRGLSDEALDQRIRADGIDILVDLAGHSNDNRLGVFGRKPAPVSVTWLGCGYTTGLTSIDYILSDATSAPAGSEPLYSEKPWHLTTPLYAYTPAEGMGDVGALPASHAGHITFGSLTRSIRINHRVIRVWSEILKRVHGARLVIDSRDFRSAYTQDLLADRFAAQGISRDRLSIGCHSPPWDVLRGLDIGLDCFPHNSGTTLFETLYMGVPFITLAGRPSLGRLGSSILRGVGHPEWIATSEDDYVEKAVALAINLPNLAALRAGLRQDMQSSPLLDGPGFARAVESAYRKMFEHWARA